MLLIRFVAAAQQSKILFIRPSMSQIEIADRSIIDQDGIKIIQTFLYISPTCSVNDNKLNRDTSIKKRFVRAVFLDKRVMTNE